MKSKLILLTSALLMIAAESFCQKENDVRKVQRAGWDTAFMKSAKLADVDNVKSLLYADSTMVLAIILADSSVLATSHRLRGQILRRLDRTGEAIGEFQKAFVIADRNGFEVESSKVLNGMAQAYTFQGDYDKALRLHFRDLIIREKLADVEDICVTLNNIGIVYYKLEDYDKAMEYYQRVLKTSNRNSLKEMTLINIGLCYNYLKEFSKGRKIIEDVMNRCGANCPELTVKLGEFGLGMSDFNLRLTNDAEKHFLVSLKFAKRLKDKRYQIENLLFLSQIKDRQNLRQDARKLLASAESMANETEYKGLIQEIYKRSAEWFTKEKDYKSATLYQSKYLELSEKMHREQIPKNLMQIHAEYEELDNKNQIATQNQILQLKEDSIKQQQFLNILTGVIAVLLVGLAVILVKVNRRKQQINVLLDQTVRERTAALEQSVNSLQLAQIERQNLMNKASSDIKSSIATVEGLIGVANLDEEVPEINRQYIKAFESTVSRLSSLASRLKAMN